MANQTQCKTNIKDLIVRYQDDPSILDTWKEMNLLSEKELHHIVCYKTPKQKIIRFFTEAKNRAVYFFDTFKDNLVFPVIIMGVITYIVWMLLCFTIASSSKKEVLKESPLVRELYRTK